MKTYPDIDTLTDETSTTAACRLLPFDRNPLSTFPKARPAKRITILLADDHGMFREALRGLLDASPGISVVGEATNGVEAVGKACDLRPSVVLMDIAMPQLYGIEACRQIVAAAPGTKVILLSGYSDDEFIERASSVGAAGYVLKQNSPASLVRAIREVVKGNSFFSPPIAQRLRSDTLSSGESSSCPASASLTPREQEVLQLVAEGAPNKQIAANLGISIKTVEKHRQHLMDKLDIHHTAGLTRYAIATRVVESHVRVTVT